MSLEFNLEVLSEKFKAHIEAQEGVSVLETEDFGWDNFRYESPFFRLAHVERYFVDGLLVVHVTCIPRFDSGEPIYGFDVVGSEKTGKISGAFLDLSPVLYDTEWHNTTWAADRALPAWASIFSKSFIAVRPEPFEHDTLFDMAYETFVKYLEKLTASVKLNTTSESWLDPDATYQQIQTAQNNYCAHQASNPRTFAAIKHHIGEERARHFMENILFPKLP
jgi:hypothetical protein